MLRIRSAQCDSRKSSAHEQAAMTTTNRQVSATNLEIVRASRSRIPRIACAFIAVLFGCLAPSAQNQLPASMPGSDLGRDNLSRVAASAADLKIVLLKDAGLLVELRRWIAKDATDHGQVVSDSDLTNDAIFERLETDSQFRAAATILVQRYGYLLPKVNPDSELGKERELMILERTKWLAQRQEEELSMARTRDFRNSRNAQSCAAQSNPDCNAAQTNSSLMRGQDQHDSEFGVPQWNSPDKPQNPPSTPRPGERTADQTQLMRTGGNPELNPPLDSGDRGQTNQSSNTFDSNFAGDQDGESSRLQQVANRLDGQTDVGLNDVSGTNGTTRDASRSYGIANGGANSTGANSNPVMGREMDMYVPPGMSPVVPSARRNQRSALYQPAEMTRAQSPYADIPSLYDMYVQAVARPTTPRRFGSEVFENGMRDPQLIPMDLPAGPDYVVGPGDGLSIDLWGGVSQRFFRTVDREGRISLPEAGPLLVSGKSLADVQQNLQQILRTQIRDVSAEVSLARLRTIRVYEVGDVANPGAYDISSLSTPLNALFAAGGPTPKGSLRIVKHYRGKQLVEEVDLYDLLLHGVKSDMARLDNGDTVLVPPVGPQVTVEGMGRRPAVYELKDEKDLAAGLELSGGLLPTAALRHIEVQRLVAHEKQTMLSLDIPDAGDSAEVTKKLEAFEIKDGDRIRIFPIASYNQDAIYLDGHVLRPGRYSYRENMHVTDIIGSYKDLLPEPASNYAEFIRLNAPDFHPTVESFDLADSLANPAQAPLLHPMDTVRIYSRFDFENPPIVSVWGDVRAPGTYRTSGQIRLGDAIHLAGGLSPDAQKEDAQVFRYMPDGKFKIFSVNLGEALAGDPTENILLQPRDRLLVHRNANAADPATVYVQGEVARPGRYPLTTNMTVADLLLVGGGLKPGADKKTADLTHFQYADQAGLTAQHESISISSALSKGAAEAAIPIHNGDVLTVRQLPGWNDLGASISVKGEVNNPGKYGIRPGERLSSILERAGGFQPDSYPYGAVLRRVQVREIEAKDQDQMILRVKDEQ